MSAIYEAYKRATKRTLGAMAIRHAVWRYQKFMLLKATPTELYRAMRKLTPGVSWQDCSKGMMAEAFAEGEHGLWRYQIEDVQRKLDEAREARA